MFMTTFNTYFGEQHRTFTSSTELRYFQIAFTASTPLRKDTGVFVGIGRFIIVLLDQSATTTLYICVLLINNAMRGNIHTIHCHVL